VTNAMEDIGLQPLPEAHLVAADLRRKAGELILMAQRLEASSPLPDNSAKVEFLFSRKKLATTKATRKKRAS